MKRRRVMYVEDCISKIVIWTDMEKMSSPDEYFLKFGKFVHKAITQIQEQCAYLGVKPCVHISPKSLAEADYEKLDRDTLHAEMEGLVASVERNDRSQP